MNFRLYIKDLKSNYRHWILIAFIILSTLLLIFYFKYAFIRIGESFVDMKNSLLYYNSELFNLDLQGDISVIKLSSVPLRLPFNLPNTWEEFKKGWVNYWKAFISLENLTEYGYKIVDIIYVISKVLIVGIPLFMLVFIVFKVKGIKPNNDYNKSSKALIKWHKFEDKVIHPIFNWINSFIVFCKEHKYYLQIALFIWMISFNIIAIIIEAFAYYFYIIASFKFVTIYIQVVKLLMDLSIMIDFIPVFIWIIIGIVLFHKFRKYIAFNSLNHMEMRNRGLINERPIVSMICGSMGKKKTTILTDMSLSQEIMFRDKAFEKILECDLKFPNFPWINLENSIKRAIENRLIYNLATCKKFVLFRKEIFYKQNKPRFIFDYDFKRFGLEYYNNLSNINIWDIIFIYVQLYFVYIIQSSLIISNYSVRVDNYLMDMGNFPLWNNDLFNKNKDMIKAYTRHAHILDFDSLRLGKRLLQENPNADSFEFGCVLITEIGKERGNNLELRETKKNEDIANQKNDLFNSWLKMVRHSATIDNYPFVKVITDEQRPESWGADARDLADILHILDTSDMRLSMPMFALEDLLISLIVNHFNKRYVNYRFLRGDNTLLLYFYHNIISKLNKYKENIYNQFGYYKVICALENGIMDGELRNKDYYLMFKKIYSNRFSTDCFSGFFNEKALRSKVGINDLKEFTSIKPSFDEMKNENSYFFNDLIKIKDKDKENSK